MCQILYIQKYVCTYIHTYTIFCDELIIEIDISKFSNRLIINWIKIYLTQLLY